MKSSKLIELQKAELKRVVTASPWLNYLLTEIHNHAMEAPYSRSVVFALRGLPRLDSYNNLVSTLHFLGTEFGYKFVLKSPDPSLDTCGYVEILWS